VPRNDWNSALKVCLPPRHCPIAPSWSHTTRRGQRSELSEDLEMTTEDVVGLTGREHPPADQPGEATDPGDHPQLGGLTEPDRDPDVGLPQIELASSPGK
jgi:hypothetical protein